MALIGAPDWIKFTSSVGRYARPQRAARNNALAVNAGEPIRMAPYYVHPGEPTPAYVVEPRLAPDFVGQQLEMKFIVDKSGRPYNIEATNPMVDRNLVTQIASALWYWRFDPARDASGNAIERKVILPVVIGSPAEDQAE